MSTDSQIAPASSSPESPLELTASRQFFDWLSSEVISLVFSTYQANKLFFIGQSQSQRLSIFERTFQRCMGLWATPDTIYLSTLYQIWRLENSLAPGETYKDYDRLYIPQLAFTTGDLDTHDVALDREGQITFVSTLFSCLATTSPTHSFRPLWKPNFISKLAAEDRCHLNGLAMKEGQPAYVTAVSQSDIHDGWRQFRYDGGLVIDVQTQEIVGQGLSMPHSPRWYQGRLWLLNSGRGEFGYLDGSRFQSVCFCPGYLRGLAFCNDYAIVGLSKPREKSFAGLPLDERLAELKTEARCGLCVVDLKRGDIVHWLHLDGVITELYDVAVLPGVRRPMALGFATDEIRRVLTIEPT
ncbi:TIGR03032 family protein [Thermosynechococcaceae cyanobacterium BACA0444]|uniref:TIGR03032 family protein n=1 Tax=Pseudocalidococcus azoricus BACA0444 TaxID=2918990 RepID=A0AAE4FRB5_9CYAN|nr:TIGR03032 family protein [Pseudocalidococcus azoricus]MDS3860716.1 TIGR03032 family protein [Pseudocalidococcus azoricus BACA0444]